MHDDIVADTRRPGLDHDTVSAPPVIRHVVNDSNAEEVAEEHEKRAARRGQMASADAVRVVVSDPLEILLELLVSEWLPLPQHVRSDPVALFQAIDELARRREGSQLRARTSALAFSETIE